ncbi:hypothetical protein [Arthrobacter sp. NPDC090010]|uniref:hypothetical protein n=1 Tax=Arthrobacter sp. NPDC090010 TaxID=3363942 RepID=UPI003822A98D
MRWGSLFEDMEAQLGESARLEREALAAELARAERAAVELSGRLRAGVGAQVELLLSGGLRTSGILTQAGNGWLVLEDSARDWLLPSARIMSVRGLGGAVAPPSTAVWKGLGLGSCLRTLARVGLAVDLLLRGSDDGGAGARGRIRSVGADYLEFVPLFDVAGEAPFTTSPTLVPFHAILALRSEAGAVFSERP